MFKIYGDLNSGNCYKLKLLCALLKLEHQWIDVDILKKETQTEDFIKKNPNGKIPILELDDGTVLAESNAILNYLANGTSFLPSDNYLRALVLQWQFFEQYSHEPYIAVARFIQFYLNLPEDRLEEHKSKLAGGYKALGVMETQLSNKPFFVGETPTIADISLYAYTHVAHEGGFDLANYPAVQGWINRIKALDGYVGMLD